MAKLRLEIELEYDADMMYGNDSKWTGWTWFIEKVLGAPEGLTLVSDEIGDEVGIVKVLRFIDTYPRV